MAAGFVSEGCRSTERCCRDAGRGKSRCDDIPSNKPIAITPTKVAVRQNILSLVKIGWRKSLELRTLRMVERGTAYAAVAAQMGRKFEHRKSAAAAPQAP